MNQKIEKAEAQSQHGSHAGHGWMMILCCIPMLVIAGVLVAGETLRAERAVLDLAQDMSALRLLGRDGVGERRGGERQAEHERQRQREA